MPAINLDFTDEDYDTVRAAATHRRLTVKSFARISVLAHSRFEPTSWTLAATNAEVIPGISSAAQQLMESRQSRSAETDRQTPNRCLWVHLTQAASVIAYPTAHSETTGIYEFILDRSGDAHLLEHWSKEDRLIWTYDDARGQDAARAFAIVSGNRRLGIAAE